MFTVSCIVQCIAVEKSAAQCSTVESSAFQCNTVQCRLMQTIAVQCSAVKLINVLVESDVQVMLAAAPPGLDQVTAV